MKRMLAVGLAAVVAAVAVGTLEAVAQAADQGGGSASEAPKMAMLTHGEVAQRLVRKLGLYRFLPGNPTDMECMILLAQSGVFPSLAPTKENPVGGWSLDPCVEMSLADFAVVLGRALRLEGEVQGDPSDPQNWLNLLKELQVPVDSVGAGVAAVKPLADVQVAIPLFSQSPEPLTKRYIPESTGAAVVNTIVFPDIAPPAAPVLPPGPPPVPVTPIQP